MLNKEHSKSYGCPSNCNADEIHNPLVIPRRRIKAEAEPGDLPKLILKEGTIFFFNCTGEYILN